VTFVGETLRAEQREVVRRMTIAGRLALALRLGDDDLELFAAARNLDRPAAAALLRRTRRIGRRPSRCFDALP